MSSATLPAVQKPESLWAIEEDLEALLNSIDLVETEEDQALIKTELANTLERAVAKRDMVAAWMCQQQTTIGAIDAEIERLRHLKETRARAISRLEEYVISIILTKGPDAKGKFARLEGHTSRFSVKKNPPSVEIKDEMAIPDKYESVTLFFSPAEWQEFSGGLEMETYGQLVRFIKSRSPNRTEIKKALEAGELVSGATIAPVKYRLQRE